MFSQIDATNSHKKYKYVFVFTYGRSGSTLLMGILNSIPNYCIRGENANFLHYIYQAQDALATAKLKSAKNSELPTHPWFGLIDIDENALTDELIDAFVKHILRPGTNHETIGFKEIRLSPKQVPNLAGYLGFLNHHFANPKIIFNHRNIDDTAKSKWWNTMVDAKSQIHEIDDRLSGISGKNVFHFFYDQISSDRTAHIEELFKFLGEEMDRKTVADILSTRHSY